MAIVTFIILLGNYMNKDEEMFIKNKDIPPLVENSGIQFLDFKIDLTDDEVRDRVARGTYIRTDAGLEKMKKLKHLCSKEQYAELSDINKSKFRNMMTGEDVSQNGGFFNISLEDALRAYEGRWFPVPVLKRIDGDRSYARGPVSWAKAYFRRMNVPDNEKAECYHLVIAVDTTVDEKKLLTEEGFYTCPDKDEVRNGAVFSFCNNFMDINEFVSLEKVGKCIENIWNIHALKEEYSNERLVREKANLYCLGYYFNIMEVLLDKHIITIPDIRIQEYSRAGSIAADVVIDVGNSRTCALITESTEVENFAGKYQIEIRDLTDPTCISTEAFPSRVEFADPSFSDDKCSDLGWGRFNWASMVRVGYEAQKLSFHLDGGENLTGLSSPKRYLWDNKPQTMQWYKNISLRPDVTGTPKAIVSPIANFFDDEGNALFFTDNALAAFETRYSRKSLMTFLINEIIAQTFCQINSVRQRRRMKNANASRYLRNIILTFPPGMPVQEKEIYENCARSAVGIYWKAMGWDDDKGGYVNLFDNTSEDVKKRLEKIWPALPDIKIQWDEAVCGQVVYLYNEVTFNYNGCIADFIRETSLKHDGERITVATVDIGGGTTDFVVNDFHLNENGDALVPQQRFRESFKIAGDDLLFDIISRYVIPSIKQFLKSHRLSDEEINSILARKLGDNAELTVQKCNLRKIFTLQVMEPLALKIIEAYEHYFSHDFSQYNVDSKTFRDILQDGGKQINIPERVLDYLDDEFRQIFNDPDFSVMDTILHVNFKELHGLFSTCSHFDICVKAFSYLAEAIAAYDCDIVLLTGRPSKLPGIVSCFRNSVPIAADRVLSMHDYHVNNWYPFRNHHGVIDDPKTTAAVGAMICNLAAKSKIDFNFKALAIETRSCIKYMGKLDSKCEHLANADVYYRDMNFDDIHYKPEGSFRTSGSLNLGYRSMNLERWPATILYRLDFEESLSQQMNADANAIVEVVLDRDIEQDENDGKIKNVSARLVINTSKTRVSSRDIDMNENDIKLTLRTIPYRGLKDDSYWLDNGILING